MTLKLIRTTALALLSAGLLTLFSTAPLAAHSFDATMMERLTQYFDTDEYGVIERLAQEENAIELHGALRNRLAESYAGGWFSVEDGALHVATTSTKKARLAAKHGASATVVNRSIKDLHALRRSVMDALDFDGKGTGVAHSISIDVRKNKLTIRHPPEARQTLPSRLQAHGVNLGPINFEESTTRITLSNDVRGAEEYTNLNNTYRCSIGFSSESGYFSAGHCGNANDPVEGYNGQTQDSLVLAAGRLVT